MSRRQQPRSPWAAKLMEILSDGEWHDVEELVEAASGLVPPGKAHRSAEAHKAHEAIRRKARGGEGFARREAPPRSADATLRSGARRRVVSSLQRRVRYGAVEKDGTKYRLVNRDG